MRHFSTLYLYFSNKFTQNFNSLASQIVDKVYVQLQHISRNFLKILSTIPDFF